MVTQGNGTTTTIGAIGVTEGIGRTMLSVHTKRAVDVGVAAVLIVSTLPVLVGIALLSAVVLRAWPFFVQERIGMDNRIFRFVKIRTLPTSCSSYAPKTALDHVEIPTVMRVLRATHLDELPQFWLVLSGKMSLVGPRPEMAVLHERLAAEAAAERLSVRPGITGLWQISAHCDGLICDRTEYDRLYVRYGNVALDAWIMVKTAEKMLFGRRIHLFDVPRRVIGAEQHVRVLTRPRRRATPSPVAVDWSSAAPVPFDRIPVHAGGD